MYWNGKKSDYGRVLRGLCILDSTANRGQDSKTRILYPIWGTFDPAGNYLILVFILENITLVPIFAEKVRTPS